MPDLMLGRRQFADEIAAIANLKTRALVEALAAVPREQFLPPGPWFIRSDADRVGRLTADADPAHVYQNGSIAIDAERQLFNGAPSIVAAAIDALQLSAGSRVLHVGAGTGYYSAVLAHVVGPSGHVTVLEVDEPLARAAQANLASMPWVQVHHGYGRGPFDRPFDAILVNAGVTHPQETWLDALTDGGRLVLPLTATMAAMGPVGKGFMVLVGRVDGGRLQAVPLSMTAIHPAIGLRDDALNRELGMAMMRSPRPVFTRLRRDAHEAGPRLLAARPVVLPFRVDSHACQHSTGCV